MKWLPGPACGTRSCRRVAGRGAPRAQRALERGGRGSEREERQREQGMAHRGLLTPSPPLSGFPRANVSGEVAHEREASCRRRERDGSAPAAKRQGGGSQAEEREC